MNASGAISMVRVSSAFCIALVRHHVVERVVQRTQIRIDLRLHVARQEAEALARFDRGAREHDAPHALSRQRIDGRGHGEIRLARSGRPDADDDVVVRDLLQILGLPWRLRLNDACARPAARCAARRRWPGPRRRSLAVAAIDHSLRRSTSSGVSSVRWRAARSCAARSPPRARPARAGPVMRHRVAAQRDASRRQARQLDQIAVVHAGEREHVGALGGQLLRDRCRRSRRSTVFTADVQVAQVVRWAPASARPRTARAPPSSSETR